MNKNISIIQGMNVHYSHLLRKLPKPRCNIPNILLTNPMRFENTRLHIICDCKNTCKYSFSPKVK